MSNVYLTRDGNNVTCTGYGIYPEPTLVWNIEPAINMTMDITTRRSRNRNMLHNIQSLFEITEAVYGQNISCPVSTLTCAETVYLVSSLIVHTNIVKNLSFDLCAVTISLNLYRYLQYN